jgi:hypothetical protein
MALMAALTLCLHHVAGFTNKSLRPMVATLLSRPYGPSQMSYDLWRLRAKGLIQRLPGTHTYVLTTAGTRAAIFYTKTFTKIIDPLFAAVTNPALTRAAPELHTALRTIDRRVASYAEESGMAA